MGMHARLGRSSAVILISSDILAMIAKGMIWDSFSNERLLAFLRKGRWYWAVNYSSKPERVCHIPDGNQAIKSMDAFVSGEIIY
jgi:hypothetical protein